MKLTVVTVSVRDNRVGDVVGEWTRDSAKDFGGFDEVEYVDLKDINLPVFDEPNHPLMQDYKHDHTKEWSKIVDSSDAFVFVTPEYDYFAPSALVNAIQYLHKEWNYKPVALVGYGGASGGMRSIQAIKPLVTTVKMMPLPESVTFHFVNNNINDRKLSADKAHTDSADAMFGELVKWSKALKTIR